MQEDLLYRVPPEDHQPDRLRKLLASRPEIRFISLVGIDLGGNDTDEKIPVAYFLKNMEKFLGGGIETDGSSVVLPEIATLNDGKVSLEADPAVNWFVDYNYEHLDAVTGLPVGTLRIPSFLRHNGERVDSRSILSRAVERLRRELPLLIRAYPDFQRELGFNPQDVVDVVPTSATELEFWVKTPNENAEVEQLSVSQVLQEQYWKRTKGAVRTALENSLMLLERYGLEPEMGHKEVGGIKARIGNSGELTHVMEQLEIDWRYAESLQAADNELLARIIIKETFRRHGLEVTFMAKPLEGVAGNGEHTHVGIALKLRDGSLRNLFSPADMKSAFLSPFGWGALLGILRNYEAIGAFVTASNDAFNRLKPGFEAPVCIVASIGRDVATPSRNRTVLAGLIRDNENPLATRFEVRAPNPHTNTYLALAALYQGMLDGMAYVVRAGKNSADLEREFSKTAGEPAEYLETDRAYRSEEDVFEAYTQEERDRLFGRPPATVWETLENLKNFPAKTAVLTQGEVFTAKILRSYAAAIINQWTMELRDRILPEYMETVRSFIPLASAEISPVDIERWEKINALRKRLMKDLPDRISLFSQLRQAINERNYPVISRLQQEVARQMTDLKALYSEYRRNLF